MGVCECVCLCVCVCMCVYVRADIRFKHGEINSTLSVISSACFFSGKSCKYQGILQLLF